MAEVDTRLARRGDERLAYQVVGSGPVDVLVAKPTFFPIDLMWDEPMLVQFLNSLSAFCRHVWFDARGTGASSAISQAEGRLVETYVDDMITVADELGLEQMVILGLLSPSALFFAATHPERTKALVLLNPSASYREADGYREGASDAAVEERITAAGEGWGTGSLIRSTAPSMAHDTRFARWAGRAERLNAPPEDAAWRRRAAYGVDVRGVLDAIRVPTLVTWRTGWRTAAQSRYVAEHIAGSKRVELPGDDWLFFVGETKPMLDAIEEFLTGRLPVPNTDRVLAVVLFIDIVSSTEQLAAAGDDAWRHILDDHDQATDRLVGEYRGRVITHMGDGMLATFDGPARAVRCATALVDSAAHRSIALRAGLHAGEIEIRESAVAGIAVHIANRISALAAPGEVLVSRTVVDLTAGSGLEFKPRGAHQLKGVPGTWPTFAAQVPD